MQRSSSLTQSVLRHPLLWGGLASLAFYAPIRRGLVTSEFVHRYFASHPVEYVITVLFFVGVAALTLKALELVLQRLALARKAMIPASLHHQAPFPHESADVGVMLSELSAASQWFQNSYLGQRLHNAVDYVRRKKSAHELDEHLRYLADADFAHMHNSFALTRIVIWAIPILGFLGTVIGITLAIAELSPEALETSLPEVTSGLGIAFDTTALALSLSIVLMFFKYFLERQETHLLTVVDDRVANLLVGRFSEQGTSSDPNVATIRRMAETVLQATEGLVQRQAELWQASISEAHNRWTQLTESAGHQLASALSEALDESLARHARTLSTTEEHLAAENHRHWDRVQQALVQSAQAVADQQSELVHQGEVLCQVVEATGQIKRLEITLNENLRSLAGTRNFEETVLSLSAAIQLLTTRLEPDGSDRSQVHLPQGKPIGNAA